MVIDYPIEIVDNMREIDKQVEVTVNTFTKKYSIIFELFVDHFQN